MNKIIYSTSSCEDLIEGKAEWTVKTREEISDKDVNAVFQKDGEKNALKLQLRGIQITEYRPGVDMVYVVRDFKSTYSSFENYKKFIIEK